MSLAKKSNSDVSDDPFKEEEMNNDEKGPDNFADVDIKDVLGDYITSDDTFNEGSETDFPEVKDNKIQDILDFLQIPSTFELDADILMPEDIGEEDTMFDVQVPEGYEMAEVQEFVRRSKKSVGKYVELLRRRNVDIARLATVIDKMQVDSNNLKVQMEVANGINIMPTSDEGDAENELLEAKLYIKRLEEKINSNDISDELSSEERRQFEELQNEVSLMRIDEEKLKAENYGLKNRLAALEEESDDEQPDDEQGFSGNPFIDDDDDDEEGSFIETVSNDGIISQEDLNIGTHEIETDDDELIEALMNSNV